MSMLLQDTDFLKGFFNKCRQLGIDKDEDGEFLLKTAACKVDLSVSIDELEKKASLYHTPIGVVLGTGIGAGTGALLGALSSEREDNPWKRGVIGGLIGAPVGAIGGGTLGSLSDAIFSLRREGNKNINDIFADILIEDKIIRMQRGRLDRLKNIEKSSSENIEKSSSEKNAYENLPLGMAVGTGMGAGAGALLGALSGESGNRLKRALLGGVLGAPVGAFGGGLTASLVDLFNTQQFLSESSRGDYPHDVYTLDMLRSDRERIGEDIDEAIETLEKASIDKQAQGPYGALLGAGIGGGTGALIGALSAKEKEDRMRRAMLGAAIGAPIGGLGAVGLERLRAAEEASLAAEQASRAQEAASLEAAAKADQAEGATKKQLEEAAAKREKKVREEMGWLDPAGEDITRWGSAIASTIAYPFRTVGPAWDVFIGKKKVAD